MTYSKTVWVDDNPPSINAANLNKMEEGIAAADEVYVGPVEPTDPNIVWWIDTSVAGGPGLASYTIQDEGVPLVARAAMNFIGTGVTVTDDTANNRTNVSVTGGLDGLVSTTGNVIQSVAGVWASQTPAQLKTSLTLVRNDVGLGSVDNTSDAAKPVSTAQQTALNLKANITYVDARTPKITVATSAPGSPAVGDLWVNST